MSALLLTPSTRRLRLSPIHSILASCNLLYCCQDALGRSYNTDDIDDAELEAELAAMEDDPSLFLSTEADGVESADYLDLPATNTQPIEAEAADADPSPASEISPAPA